MNINTFTVLNQDLTSLLGAIHKICIQFSHQLIALQRLKY